MGLKNLVLALFVLACGGSPSGSSSDGSLDCRVNCSYDGGNNKKDGNVSSDVCCDYDGSVDGKVDGSYDGNNNLDGSVDSSINDGNVDSGMNDGPVDGPIDYPVAVLVCNEWADDGLCVHRPIFGQNYCYDASGSLAGPERSLVEFRIYPYLNLDPNVYVGGPNSNTCFGIEGIGTYNSKLRVIDDLGDFADQEFYIILTLSEN